MVTLKRHIVVLTLLIWFIPFSKTLPQVVEKDSTSIKLDSARVLLKNDSVDMALNLVQEVLENANQQQNNELEFQALQLLGEIYQQNQQVSSSLTYYIRALDLAQKQNQNKRIRIIAFKIGNLYESVYAFENAFEYYQRSFAQAGNEPEAKILLERLSSTARSLENPKAALMYYQQLADLYSQEQQLMKQIEVLKKIADLNNEEGDFDQALAVQMNILNHYRNLSEIKGIADTENNIGFLYTRTGNYKKAAEYFEMAAYLDEQIDVTDDRKAQTLTNLGIAKYNSGQDDEAIKSLLKAWEYRIAEKNHVEIAHLNNIIASIYLNQRDLYNARFYSGYAIQESRLADDAEALSEAYRIASDISRRSSDYEEALDYYKMHLSIRDSLLIEQRLSDQQISQQMMDLERTESELKLLMAEAEVREMNLRQLQLEAEKQEKELEFLRQQRELQDLTIRQQQLENIKSRQELELTRQKLEAETKDQEIKVLQQQRQIQEMALEQQQLEEKERKATIMALQRDRELQDQKLEKARKIRIYTIVIFIFGLIIIVLMLIGFIHTKSTSQKLSRQKEDILQKNELLEQKSEEILLQNDLLAKQNEELEKRQAEISGAYEMLRETHLKLKNAQSQMLEQEKMASLGQLTAGIAHEINNPINFVSSNVNPLRMDLEDIRRLYEKYKQARHKADPKILDELDEMMRDLDGDYLFQEIEALLAGIEEGANRTRDIVAGLKKFSRTDQSEIILADVHEGIDSTLVLLKNAAKHKVEIIKEYDPMLPRIHCYPGKLNQVFMNIINNAIQAIEEKGEITIKTNYRKASNGIDSDRVLISIRDNGTGIPESIRNKIFDPFFTTKDVGEGTGLGLSISYGIIQQHQGKIEVKSEEGKGTEFLITLPVNVKENKAKVLA